MRIQLDLLGSYQETYGPIEGRVFAIGKRPENSIVISGNLDISGIHFILEESEAGNCYTIRNASGSSILIDDVVSLAPADTLSLNSSIKLLLRNTEALLKVSF